MYNTKQAIQQDAYIQALLGCAVEYGYYERGAVLREGSTLLPKELPAAEEEDSI